MGKINLAKLETYTASDAYPLTKQGLIALARERGADEELITLMEEMPSAAYNSQQEAMDDIRRIETTYQTGVWRTPGKNTNATAGQEERIDEALNETFPASDPPSV